MSSGTNNRYNKISEKIFEQFKKIVGEAFFFREYEIRWTYAFEATIFEKNWIPELILMPRTTEQVSEILKLANRNKIPITPRGSGTSLSGGSLSAYGGIILDLSQMNNIISINIENNLVEVEPGIICDELNEKLSPYGYFFPPDPGSSSVCSIGGMVATNAGGIQAFKYGVTKDYVLSLEVVLANGEIVNFGAKVLKSVSSYNLKDIIVGSEGTLGVITKICLRIRPLPKKRKLGLFIFEKIECLKSVAVQLRKKAIVPNLFEFLDKLTAKAVFEYLGGEFLDYPEGYVLLAEIDGNNEKDIDESFALLFDIMIQNNPLFNKIANNNEEREQLISARKAALPALSRISPSCCLEDCTILISNFTDIVKEIEEIPKELNFQNIKIATFGHMDGNLHPTFLFNENNENDRKDFETALYHLYEKIVIPAGGSITGEHGIGKIKTPFLESAHGIKILDLMSEIKNLFDPNGILNPGVGKGDRRPLKRSKRFRTLKNQKDKVLELNCMRCGFCVTTCPSKLYYKSEAYSPRGRLSVLNGLVFGDLTFNENNLINEILHTCTLCGLCKIKCPAGVDTFKIFEKTREIIHERG